MIMQPRKTSQDRMLQDYAINFSKGKRKKERLLTTLCGSSGQKLEMNRLKKIKTSFKNSKNYSLWLQYTAQGARDLNSILIWVFPVTEFSRVTEVPQKHCASGLLLSSII